MKTIKLTTWNIEHLDKLSGTNLNTNQIRRRDGIREEILTIAPDILCVVEGPNSEAKIDAVCTQLFNNEYVAIKAQNNDYGILGNQWIWFLVKSDFPYLASARLLPTQTWYDYTGGKNWSVNFWGNFEAKSHYHYRQPQVLILDIEGQQVEFIGAHLKSKFVNQGQSMWKDPARKQEFIQKSLEARIKMATEAVNIRQYINKRFTQNTKPAIFVLGDFNDGPGKEYFENQYLFFDLISNIQGDIFSAHKFLNHALFDYAADLRWTVNFKDFVEPQRPPQILLDHILFTQALVNHHLKITVLPNAGLVEHEVHDFVNSRLNSNQKTSDHKPVSVHLTINDGQ